MAPGAKREETEKISVASGIYKARRVTSKVLEMWASVNC